MPPFPFTSWLYDENTETRHLRIASLAMSCARDPTTNWIRIADTIDTVVRDHPEVDLILLGEMLLGWFNPGARPEEYRSIAEPISEASLAPLLSRAKDYGVYLCLGLPERDGEALYNTQVIRNPKGEIQARHRKRNLKPAEAQAGYHPGSVPVTVTEIKGVRTGLIVCADAASPHTMRELIRQRLDLILLSLADDGDEDWFGSGFNARMYDAWVVTANRYGDEDGWFWDGHLVVSDPCGRLRATSKGREQVLVAECTFLAERSWFTWLLRNALVKASLVPHVLQNWKRAKSYL